jgi:hypothetical protein
MSGIYLSSIWEVAGAFIGIMGGMVMGCASCFLAKKEKTRKREEAIWNYTCYYLFFSFLS